MSVQYELNGYIKTTHWQGADVIESEVFCGVGKVGDILFSVSEKDRRQYFKNTVGVKIVIDVHDGYFAEIHTAYIVVPFVRGLLPIKADTKRLANIVETIKNGLIINITKTFYD